MLISYAFSPKISIHSKKAAVNSAFNCLLYRGRVAVAHGVFYMVAFCAFAAFFHCRFYSVFAHLAMHIVDLHLYQWPPSFCYCGGTLLVQCWVSAQCCSSFRISCSLSTACRRSASWLIYLGMLPLWRGLAPHIRFSTQCMSFSTGCSCTVVAFYTFTAFFYYCFYQYLPIL